MSAVPMATGMHVSSTTTANVDAEGWAEVVIGDVNDVIVGLRSCAIAGLDLTDVVGGYFQVVGAAVTLYASYTYRLAVMSPASCYAWCEDGYELTSLGALNWGSSGVTSVTAPRVGLHGRKVTFACGTGGEPQGAFVLQSAQVAVGSFSGAQRDLATVFLVNREMQGIALANAGLTITNDSVTLAPVAAIAVAGKTMLFGPSAGQPSRFQINATSAVNMNGTTISLGGPAPAAQDSGLDGASLAAEESKEAEMDEPDFGVDAEESKDGGEDARLLTEMP